MEKLIANIYTAPSVLTILGLFFTFFPFKQKLKTKVERRGGGVWKNLFTKAFLHLHKNNKALKILVLHLTRADVPFHKGFDGVEQTKQKGGVFVSATLVRGRRIDAGGTSADARVLRQQTCFWLWSRSLWLCLRATGTR